MSLTTYELRRKLERFPTDKPAAEALSEIFDISLGEDDEDFEDEDVDTSPLPGHEVKSEHEQEESHETEQDGRQEDDAEASADGAAAQE